MSNTAEICDTQTLDELATSDTKRVSVSSVLGMHIPTSRVRSRLDKFGINKEFYEVEILFTRESAVDGFKVTDFSRYDFLTSNEFRLEFSEGEDPVAEVLKQLNNKKYRISLQAVVALTYVVDTLAHQLVLHAIESTLGNNVKTVKLENFANGISQVELYPLVERLVSFQDFLISQRNGGSTESKQESVVEQHVLSGDSEQLEFLNNDLDQRSRDFLNFVTKIAQCHLSRDESSNYNVRMTEEFRILVSNLLCDFISRRMVDMLLVLVSLTKAKTISERHVLSAVELMLSDGQRNSVYRQLEVEVELRLNVYKDFTASLSVSRPDGQVVDPAEFRSRLNITHRVPDRKPLDIPTPCLDQETVKKIATPKTKKATQRATNIVLPPSQDTTFKKPRQKKPVAEVVTEVETKPQKKRAPRKTAQPTAEVAVDPEQSVVSSTDSTQQGVVPESSTQSVAEDLNSVFQGLVSLDPVVDETPKESETPREEKPQKKKNSSRAKLLAAVVDS
jgi:hypothetical protein